MKIGNPYMNAIVGKAHPKASLPQGTKKMSNATRDDAESHANGTWTRQRRRKAHRRQMLAAVPPVVELVTKREAVEDARTSTGIRWVETKVRVPVARADRRAIATMAVSTAHALDLSKLVARETLEKAS